MTSSLAVGVVDQLRELRAAVRRVDADDHRPAERGRAEPEQVLGRVVEQHADVRRPVVGAEVGPERRSPPRLVRELPVRPGAVLEVRRDIVTVGVAEEELGGRRGWHAPAFCGPRASPRQSTRALNGWS